MPRSKRDPDRRVGWSRLRVGYRRRLAGAGITREQWEAGADLRAARGRAPRPPTTAAPPGATEQVLASWRRTIAPGWLPARWEMGDDVAAALSQLSWGPQNWEHVDFTAVAGGNWMMTVTPKRGYAQTIEIPGGQYGAKEVLKMVSDPDLSEGWEPDDDFDVES